MGMDGLSFSNTGSVQDKTSADMNSRVEQTIATAPTNSSLQVQEAATNRRVQEKEESEEEGKKQKNREQDTFEDGLVEEPKDENEPEIHVEDFENPDKNFYVKLNIKDDIIELYDSSSDRLVETISGAELGELVQKLNIASGIFVNKKV